MIPFSQLVKLSVKPFAFELLDFLEKDSKQRKIENECLLEQFATAFSDLTEYNFSNPLCEHMDISYQHLYSDEVAITFQNTQAEQFFSELLLILTKDKDNNLQFNIEYLKIDKLLPDNNITISVTYLSEDKTPDLSKNNSIEIKLQDGDIENTYHQVMCHQNNNGSFLLRIRNGGNTHGMFKTIAKDLNTLNIIAQHDKDRVLEYILDNKQFTNEEHDILKLTHDIKNLEIKEGYLPEIKNCLHKDKKNQLIKRNVV